MTTQTTNYSFTKDDINEPYDVLRVNANLDAIDTEIKKKETQIGDKANLVTVTKTNLVAAINEVKEQTNNLGAFAVASGINTYVTTISGYTLVEGQSVKIKFTNANTGTSTLNINGLGAKSILKGNGSALASGNLKAGQICNLVYGGTNFQLLGEGGEYGTAIASDVLSEKTIGTENGLINGTMLNNGSQSATLTTQGSSKVIPTGFTTGGTVTANFANLVAGNIKSGVNVGGVVGTIEPRKYASGSSVVASNNCVVVSGLPFAPLSVFYYYPDASRTYIGFASLVIGKLTYAKGNTIGISTLGTTYDFFTSNGFSLSTYNATGLTVNWEAFG